MASSITPKASITTVPVESPDARRITALEAESRRYPYSPVFRETIELLKKSGINSKTTEQVVTLTMSKEQAELLYGLVGQITAHSGFDPIFKALENAPFRLTRRRPKLHFVKDNVVTAEF